MVVYHAVVWLGPMHRLCVTCAGVLAWSCRIAYSICTLTGWYRTLMLSVLLHTVDGYPAVPREKLCVSITGPLEQRESSVLSY